MYHKKIRLGVVVVVVHDRFCRCTLFNHCSPLFVAQNAESSKRKKRAKRIFLCCVCVCVCVLQHFIIINDFVFGCQQSIWRCRILNPAWSLPSVCVCHLPLCRINIFFRIWIAFPPKSIKTCPYSILLFYIGFCCCDDDTVWFFIACALSIAFLLTIYCLQFAIILEDP